MDRLERLKLPGIWVKHTPSWWWRLLPKRLRPIYMPWFIPYEIDTGTGRWVADLPPGVIIIAHNPPPVGREAW